MKYTPEIIEDIKAIYIANPNLDTVAILATKYDLPPRSIIAKLSSLGCYKKKEYVNKRSEAPIKKEQYIQRIADMLDIDIDLLESLEKVTKIALVKIDEKIAALGKIR